MILIINCSSVSLAARVQVIFTVCKLAALAMIVITGFVRLAQGKDTLIRPDRLEPTFIYPAEK